MEREVKVLVTCNRFRHNGESAGDEGDETGDERQEHKRDGVVFRRPVDDLVEKVHGGYINFSRLANRSSYEVGT